MNNTIIDFFNDTNDSLEYINLSTTHDITVTVDDTTWITTTILIIYSSLCCITTIAISIMSHISQNNGKYNISQHFQQIWSQKHAYFQYILHLFDTVTSLGVLIESGKFGFNDINYKMVDIQTFCIILLFPNIGWIIGSTAHWLFSETTSCIFPIYDVLTRKTQDAINTNYTYQINRVFVVSIPQVIIEMVYFMQFWYDSRLYNNAGLNTFVAVSFFGALLNIFAKFIWTDLDMNLKIVDIILGRATNVFESCLWFLLAVLWNISFIIIGITEISLFWCIIGKKWSWVYTALIAIYRVAISWFVGGGAKGGWHPLLNYLKLNYVLYLLITWDTYIVLAIVTAFIYEPFGIIQTKKHRCIFGANGYCNGSVYFIDWNEGQASSNPYIINIMYIGWIMIAIHHISNVILKMLPVNKRAIEEIVPVKDENMNGELKQEVQDQEVENVMNEQLEMVIQTSMTGSNEENEEEERHLMAYASDDRMVTMNVHDNGNNCDQKEFMKRMQDRFTVYDEKLMAIEGTMNEIKLLLIQQNGQNDDFIEDNLVVIDEMDRVKSTPL